MGNSSSKRHSVTTRELEKLTQPTGLYPSCPWELKTARRLIVERKLAPRFLGHETKEGCFALECPICFMKPSSPRRSSAIGILKRTEQPSTPNSESVHYASVEERHQLRDSLRSQLSISDKPVTNRSHPNSVAALNDASRFLATPSDAAHLEELMLLEAIRRSMHDLHVGKDSDERTESQSSQRPTRGSGDDPDDDSDGDYGDVQPLSASQINISATGAVRYSNPFDSAPPSDTPPQRSSTPRWNPFD
ncbi:hypothetical protein BBJ29_004939 [Phytophthora kernoviae]|uniref:Uncharacterized protein n=1 Tax=Phytophthora kernoviae TaxID=325452 RepID=A0A3F2S0L1_9STRA|nr:hypothetical protein BBP00_00001323 [Phytophthora kernoviae]RLN70640.1 hypothetical protein BBJ29_004939 [Phytophthora kernoviae]